MTEKYQGVILAAGHGSRLGPFGELVPKPIVPICNRPLVAYQLDSMRSVGITDVIVVIGHLGHRIIQTIGDGSAYGVRVRYVEQEKRLGIAHAVGQLERHIDRPFMLMLGDIYFHTPNIEDMLSTFEAHSAAAVLAVKEESDPEAIKRNFAVLLREDGTVRRVVEKPRHVANSLKGCGLYLFDLSVFDAIRRTPRTALRDEYELTDSIQIMVDYDSAVHISSVVEWDTNITILPDLIPCCLHQLQVRGLDFLVDEDCSIAPGVDLVDSVVGRGVTISCAARFDRCVLLPGAAVAKPGEYRDKVFLPEMDGSNQAAHFAGSAT
jgi:dTDP-glucose pyrophosphorylase